MNDNLHAPAASYQPHCMICDVGLRVGLDVVKKRETAAQRVCKVNKRTNTCKNWGEGGFLGGRPLGRVKRKIKYRNENRFCRSR
jgi:hypothetical protein